MTDNNRPNQELLDEIRSLKEKEKEWDFLSENVSEGLLSLDREEIITYANTRFCLMVGYPAEHVIGKPVKAFLDDENYGVFRTRVYEGNASENRACEMTWKRRQGDKRDTGVSCSLDIDGNGQVSALYIAVTDITERKKIEKVLFSHQVRYRGIFENTSNGVAVYKAVDDGNDFMLIDFNRAGAKIENIERADVIGKSIFEVFPGVKDFGLLDVLQRVWQTGRGEHYPVAFYEDERISGWRENHIYRLPSGEIVAVYSDETEKVKAAEEVKEESERFKRLFESIPDPVFFMDEETGRIIDVNRAMMKLYGYGRDEFLGMKDTNMFVDGKIARNARKAHRPGFEVYEHKAKDGTVFPVELTFSTMVLNKRNIVIVTCRDITERKISERLVKEQQISLEEKNIALKEILTQIEMEKSHLKEQVSVNIKKVLMPITRRLRLRGVSKKYIDLIERNLEDVTASFGINISEEKHKLSPREIEIANMIKEGLSSKEISQLLNISPKTTELYRNNIRKKLGIVKKKVNLTTYLQSL